MKKITFILFLLSNILSYAQELTVSVDKNPAIVGERISIIYSINASAANFTKPNFGELIVISGPNPSTSSSYTFTNGKSENKISTTYSFYIKAVKEGDFNITPASIKVDGKTIKSKPYQIKVVKGSDRNKGQQKAIADNLFIKVEASKRNIVIGEQILVTYKLLTRLDLQNTELSSLPDLNGFWAKDLETSSRFKREIIDDTPYQVATIQKAVLTAQKAGELEIDPIELKCNIITKRGNHPFFNGLPQQNQEEIVRSKTIKIKVSDLPFSPNEFKGAVGDMKISSEVDKSTVVSSENIKYRVTIKGIGNLELIEAPKLKFSNDFHIIDTKITSKIFEGGMLRSTKTFEYLLKPKLTGSYTIPAAKLVFYNPKKNRYVFEESKRHTIHINQDIGSNAIKEQQKNTIKKSTKSTSNNDIIIAMDISSSMLARDLKPDRLEASKNIAMDFISKRKNDRMGLVLFAGESFTQSPLTTDHDVLINLFKDVKTGIIDDGTSIGIGLANAINELKESSSTSKVIILLTDGRNNTGELGPTTAAEIAEIFGIRVYTIAVGTEGFAPYPIQTASGTQEQKIEVKIDEETLKEVALITDGKYFRATDNKALEKIYSSINQNINRFATYNAPPIANKISIERSSQILKTIEYKEREIQKKIKKQLAN